MRDEMERAVGGVRGRRPPNAILVIATFVPLIFFKACQEPQDDPVVERILCLEDTTSHDFVWEIDTLGFSAWLLDVAIIDENDIWAVGMINTPETRRRDSTGVWQNPYNIAHWNGSEWNLMSLRGITYYDSLSYGQLRAVHAFSSDDVWVMFNYGSYAHWDGVQWVSAFIWDRYGSIDRIWGTSSSNLYFIGTDGNITHYDGMGFEKMESGTDLTLRTISGTAEGQIFVSGHSNLSETVVLEYNEPSWSSRYDENTVVPGPGGTLLKRINHVFVWGDTLYVDATPGLWKSSITTGRGVMLGRPTVKMGIESIGIGGDCYNDIMIIDAYGWVTHYNGRTWKNLNNVYDQFAPTEISLWGMDYKDGMVVAVGFFGAEMQAFIMRGYRQNSE